jgi:hypothetical protein
VKSLSDDVLLFETVEEALREVSGVTERTAGRAAEQASVDGGADTTAPVRPSKTLNTRRTPEAL